MSLNCYVIDDVVVFLKSRQIRWNSVLWKPSTSFPILAPYIQKSKTFQFLKRDTSHILFPKEHIWQKYFAGNYLLASEPWTLFLVHLNLSPHLDTCSHTSLLYREPHNLPVGFSDHSSLVLREPGQPECSFRNLKLYHLWQLSWKVINSGQSHSGAFEAELMRSVNKMVQVSRKEPWTKPHEKDQPWAISGGPPIPCPLMLYCGDADESSHIHRFLHVPLSL